MVWWMWWILSSASPLNLCRKKKNQHMIRKGKKRMELTVLTGIILSVLHWPFGQSLSPQHFWLWRAHRLQIMELDVYLLALDIHPIVQSWHFGSYEALCGLGNGYHQFLGPLHDTWHRRATTAPWILKGEPPFLGTLSAGLDGTLRPPMLKDASLPFHWWKSIIYDNRTRRNLTLQAKGSNRRRS